MQFDIAADDGTDDSTEPVAPGTSCCYIDYGLGTQACPHW